MTCHSTKESNIEKPSETLYNNVESESGANGNIERSIDERRSRLYEESTKEQRKFTWNEYNQWEQSIKPITENALTVELNDTLNLTCHSTEKVTLYVNPDTGKITTSHATSTKLANKLKEKKNEDNK